MAHPIISLFAPHPHNNHKAKILWPRSIVVLIGLYLMGKSIVDLTIGLYPGVLGFASQINPDKIIELTNSERLQAGVSTLKTNPQLNAAALAKATDMFEDGYWAHISPDGTEPWYFITSQGYKYLHAGENLARDFQSPADIVKAWMASPTHKRNLLDGRYKDIGIAVMDGVMNGTETTLVVQMFGTPQTSVGQISADSIVKPVLAQEPLKVSETVSPLELSRTWSLAFAVLVLIVLAMDWIFVLRQNIIRMSGKTWAHLTYFLTITALLVIIKQGLIL